MTYLSYAHVESRTVVKVEVELHTCTSGCEPTAETRLTDRNCYVRQREWLESRRSKSPGMSWLARQVTSIASRASRTRSMSNVVPTEAQLSAMSRDDLLQYAIRLTATVAQTNISASACAAEIPTRAFAQPTAFGAASAPSSNLAAIPCHVSASASPLTQIPPRCASPAPAPTLASTVEPPCDTLAVAGAVRRRLDAGDADGAIQTKKQRRAEERKFCMSRYGQRMVALKFSYLGWHFHGLATQPHTERSVEDHLFEALLGTHLIESRENCCYSRAGRTDVGVSALCQVVGLRVRSNVVPPSTGAVELDYIKMLNSLLPAEIRIMCWAPVSDGTDHDPSLDNESSFSLSVPDQDDSGASCAQESICNLVRRPGKPMFSARFDATSRAYKYFFTKGRLDIAAMRDGARYFVGKHDFRNFCKIDAAKVSNFERVMYKVEVCRVVDDSADVAQAKDEAGDNEYTRYYIFVRGQAFLWHQVRCMAAVLFEIGLGNERPDVVFRMLDDVARGSGPFSKGKPCYHMASAIPLLLFECTYPQSVVSFKVAVRDRQKIDITSFGRADADLANLYGTIAAQMSIFQTIFRANDDTPIDVSGREEHERAEISPLYGSEREPRLLLPTIVRRGLHGGKHIPFDQRRCESTLEDKQRQVQIKRARRVEN
jgi:tRNA pseudouridine38/39 synthase